MSSLEIDKQDDHHAKQHKNREDAALQTALKIVGQHVFLPIEAMNLFLFVGESGGQLVGQLLTGLDFIFQLARPHSLFLKCRVDRLCACCRFLRYNFRSR